MAQTLLECFQDTVRRWPSHGIITEKSHVSFKSLDQQSDQLACGIHGKGICPGNIIAVCLPNSLELVLLHLAILKLGAIALPINPRYTVSELQFTLQDSQAACLFSLGLKALPSQIVHSSEAFKFWVDVEHTPSEFSALFSKTHMFTPVSRNPDDLACICYTSGTTGVPKGACLSHKNLVFDITTLLTLWEVTAEDRLLLTLPMFHVHGLMLGLFGCFMKGYQTWICSHFEAESALRQLKEFQITFFMGVPTMYHRMLQSHLISSLADSSMRLFTSGSAPLSTDLFQKFSDQTGYTIVERYGLTETLINTSNPYHGERRPGTVGQALPGIKIQILDEHKMPLVSGKIGEICVKGPNVFQGYLNRPEANQASFHEGWFMTGDLGCLHEDGTLEIVGRQKELIITGGYNVYPNEVEQTIQQFSGVIEAAVVGLADEDLGEQVTAFVVLDNPHSWSTEGLTEACTKFLASYKIPKQFYFCKSLPRNALGKIQKHQLIQDWGATGG